MYIGLEGTHRHERKWEGRHIGDIGYHEIDMGVHKQVSIVPRYPSPITVTYSRTHSQLDDVCVMLTETGLLRRSIHSRSFHSSNEDYHRSC